MRVCIVEDELLLGKSLIRYFNSIEGFNIEYYKTYENLVPDDSVDVYFLDHDNPYGINGSRWLEFYGSNVRPNKRLLTSGDISKWNDFVGVKLLKPYSLKDLEDTLDLMYDNNKRFRK